MKHLQIETYTSASIFNVLYLLMVCVCKCTNFQEKSLQPISNHFWIPIGR